MKLKSTYSILLAASLTLASLGGCGTSESSSASSDTAASNPDTANTAVSENSNTENTSATDTLDYGNYNVTWEDMAEIVVVYPTMNTIQAGLQDVEDAINEITESEINTHVTLNMIEVGNYDQQINLMMTSGEQIDLMITMPGGPASFATMTSQNQLIDISDMLNEYAPRAIATIGDMISGTQIDRQTFAFPTYHNYVSGVFISMRTDVLEDLGLVEKAENMTTLTEFEEIMEAVKSSEKWSYLAGIAASDGHGRVLALNESVGYTDKFSEISSLDNLGDTLYTVGIQNNNDTVLNTFASEEYRHNYEIVKDWYDKGYVYRDSATTQEMGSSLVRSNVVFAISENIELGSEETSDMNCGMPMTSVCMYTLPITTGSLTKFTWAVPQNAKDPEAAVTFLEMMFNDSRIANLFAWGIEGTDYTVDDNGVAHYIDGNETPAYHTVSFLNANKFIVTPWEGEDPEVLAQLEESMKSAQTSKYLGFVCDTTAITSEISAVNNAIEEFNAQITSGAAEESVYEDYLQKLEDIGIDKIVQTYQEQLDEWLVSNN